MVRATKLSVLALLLVACGQTTSKVPQEHTAGGAATAGQQPTEGGGGAGGTVPEGKGAGGAAPADVDAGEAGEPLVSGGQAGAAGQHNGPTWCDGQAALFCEDFDREPPLALWQVGFEQGGAELNLDEQAFVSPPRALLTTSPRLHQGEAAAQLVAELPRSGVRTIVAFDVFIERHTTDIDPYEPLPSPVELFHLASGVHSMNLDVQFYPEHQVGVSLTRDYGASSWGGSTTLPFATWFRIELDVTYSHADDGIVAVTLAGQPTMYYEHGNNIPIGEQDPLALYLGVRAHNVAPAVTIAYDNVTVDIE